MRKRLISLFVLVWCLLMFSASAFASEFKTDDGTGVIINYDNDKNVIKMSTTEEGTILYAYKTAIVNEQSIDGTVIDDGKSSLIWGYVSEEEQFKEDHSNWLEYKEDKLDYKSMLNNDTYYDIYACVKHENGTFSKETHMQANVPKSKPTIKYSVKVASDKHSATISVTATSPAGIEFISNDTTKKVVYGSSATFDVDYSEEYVITAGDKLDHTDSVGVLVKGIERNLPDGDTSALDEDIAKAEELNKSMKEKPVITVKGYSAIKKYNKPVKINISAAHASGIDYLIVGGNRINQASCDYTIEQNGNYTFMAYSYNGKVAKYTLDVNNIKPEESKVKKVKTFDEGDIINPDVIDREKDINGASYKNLPQTGGVAIEIIIVVSAVCIIIACVLIKLGFKKPKEDEKSDEDLIEEEINETKETSEKTEDTDNIDNE